MKETPSYFDLLLFGLSLVLIALILILYDHVDDLTTKVKLGLTTPFYIEEVRPCGERTLGAKFWKQQAKYALVQRNLARACCKDSWREAPWKGKEGG